MPPADRAPSAIRRVPFYRSKPFKMVLGVVISIVCLWLAARPMIQDRGALAQLGTEFREANYLSLPPMLLVLAAYYWLKAWRWRLLLAPVGRFRPTQDLLPPIMIGFSFNNILPGRVGEFVRCAVVSRQQRIPLAISLSSVVLERLFDGLAIVCYLGLGLFLIPDLDPRIRTTAYVVAIGAISLVVAGLIYVTWTKPFVDLFEAVLARLRFVPEGLRKKICGLLEAGAQGLSALKDIRLVISILVISFVKWAMNSLLVLLSLWSFGIHVPVAVSAIVMGVVALGVAVPSSPGYFGVIQFCFMSVLKLFSTNHEAIFAASIYFQLAQYVPVTLIGLYYFVRSGLSLQQVEAAEEQAEAAGAGLAAG